MLGKYNRNAINSYDKNGLPGYRTSATDGSGETYRKYDLRGRIVEEVKTIVNRGPYTTRWRYDNQDRVKQMLYPNGELVSFAHNFQGELAQKKERHCHYLLIRNLIKTDE